MALEDKMIRAWIKNDVRFDAKSAGNGLYVRYRQTDKTPIWFLRFKIAKIEQRLIIGRYPAMTLALARKEAIKNQAEILNGNNPAAAKRELKKATRLAAIREKSAQTVSELVDVFFENRIDGIQKNAHQRRLRVNKHLLPYLGKMKLTDVLPMDVSRMLDAIKATAPTVANDILTDAKQLFNYAIKRHLINHNPAAAFNAKEDAGGTESNRNRWLNIEELTALFKAMRECPNVTRPHYQLIKLLLLFGNRKSELFKSKRNDFDLNQAIWHLSADNKSGKPLKIPLTESALIILKDVLRLQIDQSEYLFPTHAIRTTKKGHINEGYLNRLIKNKVIPLMGGVEHFTIHDFRHTVKSNMSDLGILPFISERCLNHKIPGMAGVYDNFDYLPERTHAMMIWANRLDACEAGEVVTKINVIPFKKKA